MNFSIKSYLFFGIKLILLEVSFLSSKPFYQWKINKENSYIKFEIPLFFSSVYGKFNNYSLKNFSYNGHFKSLKKKELWIDIQSITTGSFQRDEALRSKYFLNSQEYPFSIIRIIEIYPLSEKSNFYLVTFEIKIKSYTRQITELFYIEQYLNKIIAKGIFYISRKEFDIKGNLLLDLLMKEWIKCEFYLEILYTK